MIRGFETFSAPQRLQILYARTMENSTGQSKEGRRRKMLRSRSFVRRWKKWRRRRPSTDRCCFLLFLFLPLLCAFSLHFGGGFVACRRTHGKEKLFVLPAKALQHIPTAFRVFCTESFKRCFYQRKFERNTINLFADATLPYIFQHEHSKNLFWGGGFEWWLTQQSTNSRPIMRKYAFSSFIFPFSL